VVRYELDDCYSGCICCAYFSTEGRATNASSSGYITNAASDKTFSDDREDKQWNKNLNYM